jgi:hypothetical protein
MFVNKIDKYIDDLLDKFFFDEIKKNKSRIDYSKTKNISEYYKLINNLIVKFIDNININDIKKIINKKNNIPLIISIVRKYIIYYVMMLIGFNQTDINNYTDMLIKFSKLDEKKDFLDSESISILTKFFPFIKKINEVVNIVNPEEINKLIEKDEKYKDIIIFLNELGNDYIVDYLKGNKYDNIHNTIKIIVFKIIYIKNERPKVLKILSEEEEKEYKYIEIIAPKSKYIDYSVIENLLSFEQIREGVASDFFELIQTHEENTYTKGLTYDDKINMLFDNNIITPIVEDFLRYHKDSEKYDRFASDVDKKKKDDTKIKYIINKMNKIISYYSKKVYKNETTRKNIERLFYVPLAHKRAVIVNDLEEVKIIDKLIKQGKTSIEKNEHFIDLINYRIYPFSNFRDFKQYGFTLKLDKTIDIIRNTSFEDVKNRFNYNLELRVGSNDQKVKVVGVALNNDLLQCQKVKHYKNIRYIEKNNNSYNNITNILKNNIIKDTKQFYPSSYYWIFDINKDKVTSNKFQDINALNQEDYSKLLIAKLYDDIEYYTFIKIKSQLENKDHLSISDGLRIFDKSQEKTIKISTISENYKKLHKLIFYDRSIKSSDDYDTNENIIPGVVGDIIKLPVIKKEKRTGTVVTVGDEDDEALVVDNPYENAMCQHYITWDKISSFRNRDPNLFNQKLFEFYKKFVVQNEEQDYICKSCNHMLDIKRFLSTTGTGKGAVILQLINTRPLEELEEYEKYNKSIKNIDKIIERIGNISNLIFYVGNDIEVKFKRQHLTKEVIDFLLIHHKTLSSTDRLVRRGRLDEAIKTYGISGEYASFFLFKLTNDIFIFSSKEVDKYKELKYNNILVYIILSLISDLKLTHIENLAYDKLCNYYFFDKYGYTMFDGLYIRINDGNDLVPIKNYKLLCYVIYYFSCLLVKYKIWFYSLADKKQKFSPTAQKMFIHTFVQLINSILEVNSKKEKHYLYELVATKFLVKLDTVFTDTEIFKKLIAIKDKKIQINKQTNKLMFVKTTLPSMGLLGEVPVREFRVNQDEYCYLNQKITYLEDKIIDADKIMDISLYSNCPNGEFHKWKIINGKATCVKCKMILGDILSKKSKNGSGLLEQYKQHVLKQLSKDYCVPENAKKTKTNVICKDDNNYTKEELNKLQILISSNKQKTLNKIQSYIDDKIDFNINKEKQGVKFTEKLETKYKNSKIYEITNKFMMKLEEIIGTNININNTNTYIRYDTYIIDHNYLGNSLDKPIIIVNKKNNVNYKYNDPFFKTDVIFYKDNTKDINIYYDMISRNLLGYKEVNKDYVKLKKSNQFIKINVSLTNKFKLLGFKSRFIDITKKMEEYNTVHKDTNVIQKRIINDLIRDRMVELKHITGVFQKVISQIKFNYTNMDVNNISKAYGKKIKRLIVKDKDIKIFKYNNLMSESIYYKNTSFDFDKKMFMGAINPHSTTKYINITRINDLNNNDALIINYLVDELTKLIDINSDKFTKIHISNMIIDIIETIYSEYIDIHVHTDIKKFSYIVEKITEYDEYKDQGVGFYGELDREMTDDEKILHNEQKYDDESRVDAIDVTNEVDPNDEHFGENEVFEPMKALDLH